MFRLCLCLLTGCSLGAMTSGAAQPAVESFNSGANGWVGTSDGFTGGFWSFTGGVASFTFPDAGFAFPDICTLSNGPGATSGSFTGDYEAAGIEVIGFSFLASAALPASGAVELEWAGSTSVYRRGFYVTQTGHWYQFSASMQEADKEQWAVITGSLDDFQAARQSVSHTSLRMARSVTTPHVFIIDNVFVAGRPGGTSATAGPGGGIVWDNLLPGLGYQVQVNTNLAAGAWTPAESLTATGYFHSTIITNSGLNFEAFRLRFQ